MLMLVHSGSSISFIGQHMVDKMGLQVEPCDPVRVRATNGGMMTSDQVVKEVRWCSPHEGVGHWIV